ncbi:hypothetical protein [Cellulomonas sp.]|uniref:hypothetical protein n=1 Tax=Cellulomonas sp. TaxID=40001 RepID=UPI001B0C4165|nr:hypothetical protein [Cellulomonas sp.]MBO9553315.1 hypothetical protein [Cellulomonas sp.]
MNGVLLAGLALAAPSPSPSGVEITDAAKGSPGFIGFVVTFLLALAAVGLFLSLTKQLRVVDRRAKQLGLDDDADAPHQDRGVIDAGAAGPDAEVDADVDTTLRDYGPDGRPRGNGDR